MFAVGDRVEAQDVGVGAGHLDRPGEQFPQSGLGRGAECGRIVGDRGVVEDRHRGVEMVEPRIDEFQCDNGHAGYRGNFGVGLPIGPEAGAGQDGHTGHQEVALAFVDVTGGDRGVALLAIHSA